MKRTEFKVHSFYSKEDILQMEKVAAQRPRRIGLTVTVVIFLLYGAVILWERFYGEGHASLFSFISGGTLDMILMAVLLFFIILLVAYPYIQLNKILKTVSGGVLKANFYFYEKTFQYGWGETFTTVSYAEIEELKDLTNTIYIRARGVSYWVKKQDFVVGTAEELVPFLKEKMPAGKK